MDWLDMFLFKSKEAGNGRYRGWPPIRVMNTIIPFLQPTMQPP
jgi:hypothetical protein